MDKEYKDLFNVILKNMEIVSEETADHYKNDSEKIKSALQVRDLAAKINEKIQKDEPLTKAEWAIVLTGATISKNLIIKNANRLQTVILLYNEMIPKIEEITKADDDQVAMLVEKIFASKIEKN